MPDMVLLVLDTSVILKWFKEEEYTEAALKIKEEFIKGVHEIVVPDLLLYEFTNALRYQKFFNKTLIKKSLSNLIDLDLNIVLPTREMLFQAAELANEYEITVYDAVFVVLARLIHATFVTGDKKLYEKIKKLKFVKFLTKFK